MSLTSPPPPLPPLPLPLPRPVPPRSANRRRASTGRRGSGRCRRQPGSSADGADRHFAGRDRRAAQARCATPVGLVSPGLVSAGLSPQPGVVAAHPARPSTGAGARRVPCRPGSSDPGWSRPGARQTRAGQARARQARDWSGRDSSAGAVRPGVPSPGLVRPARGSVPRPRSGPASAGRLTPNWDKPLRQRAHQLAGQVGHRRRPGRTRGARAACCRGRFVNKEVCARTRDCQGGDRAHGCRELASTSVRHGSLLNLDNYVELRVVSVCLPVLSGMIHTESMVRVRWCD